MQQVNNIVQHKKIKLISSSIELFLIITQMSQLPPFSLTVFLNHHENWEITSSISRKYVTQVLDVVTYEFYEWYIFQ